jgi:hypothetical protein
VIQGGEAHENPFKFSPPHRAANIFFPWLGGRVKGSSGSGSRIFTRSRLCLEFQLGSLPGIAARRARICAEGLSSSLLRHDGAENGGRGEFRCCRWMAAK